VKPRDAGRKGVPPWVSFKVEPAACGIQSNFGPGRTRADGLCGPEIES
jgi:hypothetical protein